jgi:transaldolase
VVFPVSRLDDVFPHGQSLWFDFIRRDLLDQGGLARLIDESAIRGLTSNPAIFKQAIAGTALYDGALQAQIEAGERDPERLYEGVAIADIQQAADAFRALYDESEGLDGWVSLEVSPRLIART